MCNERHTKLHADGTSAKSAELTIVIPKFVSGAHSVELDASNFTAGKIISKSSIIFL